MGYASDAQRKFFHSPAAQAAGIKQSTIQEMDRATKSVDLPAYKPKKKKAGESPWIDMKKAKVDSGGDYF